MFLYSTDPEWVSASLYRACFQIEFAFRNAKQHLVLNDGEARSQDKLHFHCNRVFAALFWALYPALSQAVQFRRANPKTHHRTVGRELKHRPCRGLPPPYPTGTPVAASIPSRIRVGRPLNTALEPDLHTGSGLKMYPNHRSSKEIDRTGVRAPEFWRKQPTDIFFDFFRV